MPEEKYKKIVLLHSNDIHADLYSKQCDGREVGGLALLAGYLKKVRSEEKNVIYVIAGDMFNGSVLDSEYDGLTTMLVMDYLAPDAVCVGNHEVDYGISHTLFIERCAEFPLINANIYVEALNKRLYEPYVYVTRDGLKFMFVGITTEQVVGGLKHDAQVGKYIEVHNPIDEIELICNTYNSDKVDIAIVLSHIGLDEDIKLAEKFGSDMGIDAIIGGHSHTLLEEPKIVNGIPIVQVGWGTGQIGRFDLYYDAQTNEYHHATWSLVTIDEQICEPDLAVQEYLQAVQDEADLKYKKVLCHLSREVENGARNRQTELGSLFAELLGAACGLDVFLMSTAQLRVWGIGPTVTYENVLQAYPYANPVYRLMVTGAQLRSMLEYSLSRVDFGDPKQSIFQVSRGLFVRYSQEEGRVTELTLHGESLCADALVSIGMSKYAFDNLQKYFGVDAEQLAQNSPIRTVATNDQQVLIEYMTSLKFIEIEDERRIEIK